MDLSPASMAFGILFGCYGLMCVQIGKRRQAARPLVIGFSLMALSFVGSTWWSWPLAILLAFGAFLPL